jgi:hypothetical protein
MLNFDPFDAHHSVFTILFFAFFMVGDAHQGGRSFRVAPPQAADRLYAN